MWDSYQWVTQTSSFSLFCQLMALSSALLPKPAILAICTSSWLYALRSSWNPKCLAFFPALALVDTLHQCCPHCGDFFLLDHGLWPAASAPSSPVSMCQGLTVDDGLMVPLFCFVLNCVTQFILLILALIHYILGCSLICVLYRLYVFWGQEPFKNFCILQCLRDHWS